MQLMRERDVPVGNTDRVFRSSRARAAVVYLTMLAGISWLFVAGSRKHAIVLQVFASIGLIGAYLGRRFLLARFRPSNWLVRETENGLYLHFRSYLNYHFSPDDPTVAFIPYREISRTRRVRVTRAKPDLSNPRRTVYEILQVAEVDLTCDTSPLAAALSDERGRPAPAEKRWYGSSTTKINDYPVAVEGTTVQVVWQCAPRISTFLAALVRRHIALDKPAARSTSSQTTIARRRADDEREIAELARSGQVRAAVAKAALVYMKEPVKAKQVIDALRRGEIPGDIAA
jgi:hypothetical protein